MSMQQPGEKQLGVQGQTAVKQFFEDLGWGAIVIDDHDLGTDVLAQIRNDQLVDLSLALGAQVKTGDSWFDEPVVVDGLAGWYFRESTQKHANYWRNNPIPHILILQNTARTVRKWQFLDSRRIENTGKGFRVFVPENQTLEREWLESWTETATIAQKRIELDGLRWKFEVASVHENDRGRLAMLAPQVVAPHPNKGQAEPIDWSQAIALCISTSAHVWFLNSEKHASVPTLEGARAHADWGWRFAAAVHDWVYQADASPLIALKSGRQSRPKRVLHAIATATALVGGGDLVRAFKTLEPLLAEGEYSQDQTWLLVHLANIAYERGDRAKAHQYASDALTRLAPLNADVATSTLRASATWAAYQSADVLSFDVGTMVMAIDTATTWWRARTAGEGAVAAVAGLFDRWGNDKTVTYGGTDVAHNELFSASLAARLAGASWQARSSSILLAKSDLLSTKSSSRASTSLSALLEAGDHKALALAIPRLEAAQQDSALTTFAEDIALANMTHTNAQAMFKAIRFAGPYMSNAKAATLRRALLGVSKASGNLATRLSLRFDLRSASLEALLGLREGLTASDSKSIADLIAELTEADQTLSFALGTLARSLRLSEASKADLVSAFEGAAWWKQLLILHALRPSNTWARSQIHDAIMAGNLLMLEALGRVDLLTLEEAQKVVDDITPKVVAEVAPNPAAGVGIGGTDLPMLLGQVSFNFPTLARWDPIIAFLGAAHAIRSRKRNLALMLAHHAPSIPADVQTSLREAVDAVRDTPSPFDVIDSFGMATPLGAALDLLVLALTAPNTEEWQSLMLRLLTADSASRADLVGSLAFSSQALEVLVALTADPDDEVSKGATQALAVRLANSVAPPAAFIAVLQSLASTGAARLVVSGLSSAEALAPAFADMVKQLRVHPSRRVRSIAATLVVRRVPAEPIA